MPTRRQERVNARIVQEVSEIIREIREDKLGFITVIKSEVSPDLRHAKVFVSILGDEDEQKETLNKLNKSTGFVRKMLGKGMQTKVTPIVNFKLYKGVSCADEMSQLISDARSTDQNPGELVVDDEIDGDEE